MPSQRNRHTCTVLVAPLPPRTRHMYLLRGQHGYRHGSMVRSMPCATIHYTKPLSLRQSVPHNTQHTATTAGQSPHPARPCMRLNTAMNHTTNSASSVMWSYTISQQHTQCIVCCKVGQRKWLTAPYSNRTSVHVLSGLSHGLVQRGCRGTVKTLIHSEEKITRTPGTTT